MNNFKKILATTTTTALVFAYSAIPALAATISNGSFETGTEPDTFSTLSAGDSTTIPGWTVGDAGIDYIGSYWTAQDGARSLDLSALNAGTVSQTFTTVVNMPYVVSFYMAANPDSANSPRSLKVDVGGPATTYTFSPVGTKEAMGWEKKTFNFVASSTSTTLTFTSLEANAFGPALDNVTISDDVPAECTGTYGAPIFGTNGSNSINGTTGNDLIFALGGDDIINGNGGDDCIVAGNGNDLVNSGNGDDVVLGGNGNDSISGGNGNDKLYGEDGKDSIDGGNDNDMIWGGDNNDSLTGGNGMDTIKGGTGNDSLSGGNGSDDLDGEIGSDSASGGAATDTCVAEAKSSCEL